jgi:hypothetical protein
MGRIVRIVSENHSCDCTTVEIQKRELQPGESTTVAMTVRVPPVYVKKDVSCVLGTDLPDASEWVFHVQFEGFPSARVVPSSIDMGTYAVAQVGASGISPDRRSPEAWLEILAPAAK